MNRLTVLRDAMNAFADASGDLDRLLSVIARHTSEALGAGCSFLVLDDDGTAFKAVAIHSPIPELAAYMTVGTTWPVDSERPPAPILRAGKTLLLAPVTDAMLRARWPDPAEYEAVRRLGIPSMLIVPMRVHGSVIGGFTLFRFGADVPTFEEGEIALAQSLADHAAIALANARLRERTQRELAARERLERRLRATGALAQELTAATSDYRHLIELFTRRIGEELGAACLLRMVSAEGRWVDSTACVHHADAAKAAAMRDAIAGHPLSLVDGVQGRVASSGRPVLIPVTTPEQMAEVIPDYLKHLPALLGVRSVIVAPLLSRGQVIGVASLIRGGSGPPFTDDDLQFFEDAASHASLAITNARWFGEAQAELVERERLEHRLLAMSTLADELTTASSDYQRLLDLFTRRMGELLGDGCSLRLVSDDRQWLEKAGSVYHPDPEIARLASGETLPQRIPIGQGPAASVVATGRPLFLPEVDTQALLSSIAEHQRPVVERLHIHGLLIAPLLSGGHVIGIVSLFRTQPGRPYTAEDLRLFEDAAGHAALAISNARLFQTVQRELAERERLAGRLRLLSDLSHEFAAGARDTRSLVRLVARRVAEVLGDGCSIRMLTDDRQALESPGVMYHEDLEELRYFEAVMAQQPQRLDEGISGRVATTGETVLIPVVDPAAFGARAGDEAAAVIERVGMRSILVTALSANEQIMGVLAVYRTRSTVPFSDEDRRLLEGLATHASLAIANGQLLERTQREMAERVRTQEVLRRGFLEAAPDAVIIVDAAGVIQLVNTQTETLFGYARSELVGMPIDALVPERYRGDHAGHRREYLGAAATRPMGAGLDLFALRKDGTEFAAEISLSPIETPEGTLVAAAVRDVTERRREMEERNRRMQEANRLKSEFLANMSHELRTPLNAVIGFAALLHSGKAGALADLHKEYVGDILTSSRHLLQLINDVLDLSKVEAGRMDLRVEVTDVSRTTSEVRDIIRGLAAERNIRLKIDVHPDVTQVQVDPRLLKQVLYNYLSNAIKFTLDGGSVTLRIAPDTNDHFRIDVEDTGIGIKPEDMNRLFVEFQQLDQGAAKKYPGTGLGLALTKRIVEAQGGRVQARSVPGRGSTFSAILPRKVEARHGG